VLLHRPTTLTDRTGRPDCFFEKRRMTKAIRMALLLAALVLPAGGCLAVAAGAGAAGAIAYSERGAESRVSGNVSAIEADARAVLTEMAVTLDSHDPDAGNENSAVVSGMQGETRIRVEIERQSSTTSEVMVTAREGALDYNRDMSRDILSAIIARR
jgi:hypothetical protein